MRFNVQQHFQAGVSDTVTVADPWGLDLVLEVYRENARELLKMEKERQRQSTVGRCVKVALVKAGAGVLSSGDPKQAAEAFSQLVQADIEKLNPSDDELEKFFAAQRIGAALRIKSWSGKGVCDAQTGQLIACTEQAKLELLESPEVIPAGQPFAGESLGSALIQFIHDASAGQEVTREKYLADLGKGSGSMSGGSSEPGPTTPTSEGNSET